MKPDRIVAQDQWAAQPARHVLDFYTQPALMTAPGRHASLFDALPEDVAALTGVIQGLAIHEFVASRYGVAVPDARRSESHIRPVETMLDRLLELDPRPLSVARPPERRLVGVCHHFALLLVAMLRHKGIPARYRAGFGSYFNAPYFEDHVVCEYWKSAERRWLLADPQFDQNWREGTKIDHDILDVPRNRFLIAGDAWAQCRAGHADPSKFGIFVGEQRGLWFIAGDIVRDVAALNNREMLPWDVWGAMPLPNETLTEAKLAWFDRLAALSLTPDASYDDLRELYHHESGLPVPETVFNALLERHEPILAARKNARRHREKS